MARLFITQRRRKRKHAPYYAVSADRGDERLVQREFGEFSDAFKWATSWMRDNRPLHGVYSFVRIDFFDGDELHTLDRWVGTFAGWDRGSRENPGVRSMKVDRRKWTRAKRLAALRRAYPGRDVGGWDLWSYDPKLDGPKAQDCGCSKPNPLSKDANTLLTFGGIVGGFALLLIMVKVMAPKKKEPAPLPPPGPKPVTFTEPVYRVYQRYIENLDQPNARCTVPTLVFEGSQTRANELAWQITTRDPVGGKGVVAVSVPIGFAVRADCNWRRVCTADACMGIVGL